MERMMPENIDEVLHREHIDRYEFFKSAFKGQVLDIACGIGYGSKLITSLDKVESYSGKDVDQEAINIAKSRYATEKAKFTIGDITNINEEDSSIDTMISFETLEHLNTPQKAINEAKRVLSQEGVWVGSVPSEYFDNICEKVYGKNPYHVTRFTVSELESSLKESFQYVLLFSNELTVNSSFRILKNDDSQEESFISHERDFIGGSIAFIATNSEKEVKRLQLQLKNEDYFIGNLVDYDQVKYIPIKSAFDRVESMVKEKDIAIQSCESMIDEKDAILNLNDEIIENKEKEIEKNQSDMQSIRTLLKLLRSALKRKIISLLN